MVPTVYTHVSARRRLYSGLTRHGTTQHGMDEATKDLYRGKEAEVSNLETQTDTLMQASICG